METALELKPDDLYRACDPAQLEFETTDELENLVGVVGQQRALDAEFDEKTIAKLANEHDAKLLLINQESRLFNDATVESLVNDLNCPVGLVRRPADE